MCDNLFRAEFGAYTVQLARCASPGFSNVAIVDTCSKRLVYRCNVKSDPTEEDCAEAVHVYDLLRRMTSLCDLFRWHVPSTRRFVDRVRALILERTRYFLWLATVPKHVCFMTVDVRRLIWTQI